MLRGLSKHEYTTLTHTHTHLQNDSCNFMILQQVTDTFQVIVIGHQGALGAALRYTRRIRQAKCEHTTSRLQHIKHERSREGEREREREVDNLKREEIEER